MKTIIDYSSYSSEITLKNFDLFFSTLSLVSFFIYKIYQSYTSPVSSYNKASL